ncbi:hypothetical protein BACT_0306 [Bifidobacterium actinocoloniiforme DSM 22766]|uniref:Colicin transporter n=1 Tax=Bifidobacterium actinocoloniiforme DSM 22766 TaxID=1437605 RepID=A0A086YVV0_9BIFI|nr:hypothetical protein [Bifidobacterium actinocoloniiforme]KFI38400.1 hypothetical protein BACT_0306 [Bifidobacterium actinocoloniiforme DSM 22766]
MDEDGRGAEAAEGRRWSRGRMMALAGAIVVVALLLAAGLGWWSRDQWRRALADCQQAAAGLSEQAKAREPGLVVQARAVQEGQVTNRETLTALQAAVKGLEPVKPEACQVSQGVAGLRSASERMRDQMNRRQWASVRVQRAAKAVLASRDAKSLADAKAALKAKQDEGSARLAQTDGQVADDATRERLLQALDAAGKVSSSKPSDYQQAQAAIQAALDQVNASAQAKAEADAQAAQAAQAAPAQAVQQSAPVQRSAPSYSGGGSSYRPSVNRGGGWSAPAPAAPAAPQGGGVSADVNNWMHHMGNPVCQKGQACGIG